MPKPELGTKRTCLACGARFYDFGKTADLACPACGAPFDLELVARARRPRAPTRAVPATAAAEEEEVDEAEVDEAEDEVEEDEADEIEDDEGEAEEEAEADEPEAVETEDDEEEDALIEDASELGDDDALGDVIDNDTGDEEEGRR